MGTESIKDMVLPRGAEGLNPEGGWKEGQPMVSPEALAALNQEAGRVQALDTAERVARGTAKQVVDEALDRQKTDKAGQLKAFKSFMWALEDLAGKDAGAVADPAETRLVFRLFRLEDVGGVKPQAVYQTAVSFGASEALAMGDPDLEGRAQVWAEKAGRFGRYQWRLLGWAAGEQTLDTTFNVTTEPPPGYQPPAAPPVEIPTTPPKDPMENLKESLGLIGMMKDALGLGQASGGKIDAPLLETTRAAARNEAFMESDREHRAEVRKLEDRWEQKLEAAKTEAYNRGVQDGKRTAEDEYRPKLWDLERQLGNQREPTIIEEAVRMVGGPEIVQALARTFIATAGRPAAPAGPPTRPVVPLQPRPAAASQPPPAAVAQAPLPEPTRAEWRQALEGTEEALEIIAEHGDESPETAQLRAVLEAFRKQGEEDGPLGHWWQAWTQFIRQAVQDVLGSVEPEETEAMDLMGLKALLSQRLAEGATDQAILEELGHITTPEARAEWRRTLAFLPEAVVLGMIEGDPERIKGLLAAFAAGN